VWPARWPTGAAAPEGAAVLASSAALAGVAVLIVDDNATQRSVLTDYLTGWGMIVATAETGEGALSTFVPRPSPAGPSSWRSSTGPCRGWMVWN
jgi:hypothetical protein